MQQPRYKPTGCLAIDMVAACKDHYAQQGIKVERVYLTKPYWKEFNKYLLKQIPGHVDEGFVDFDDTIVMQSSIIQADPIHFVLEGTYDKKQKYDA